MLLLLTASVALLLLAFRVRDSNTFFDNRSFFANAMAGVVSAPAVALVTGVFIERLLHAERARWERWRYEVGYSWIVALQFDFEQLYFANQIPDDTPRQPAKRLEALRKALTHLSRSDFTDEVAAAVGAVGKAAWSAERWAGLYGVVSEHMSLLLLILYPLVEQAEVSPPGDRSALRTELDLLKNRFAQWAGKVHNTDHAQLLRRLGSLSNETLLQSFSEVPATWPSKAEELWPSIETFRGELAVAGDIAFRLETIAAMMPERYQKEQRRVATGEAAG